MDLISGLSLSYSNYVKAVELLKDRFGNRQILITKHLDILATLPRVEDINDVISLRKLFDTLETSVRNLSDLGKETETYGSLLISIIFDRIPSALQIIISRHSTNRDWDLTEVINIFKEELQARERCEAISHKDGTFENNSFSSSPFTAQAFMSRNQSEMSDNNCVYCNQSHASTKCHRVTDVSNRFNILKKSRQCFLCLRKYHAASNCYSKNLCVKCNRKLNASICFADNEYQNRSNGSKGENIHLSGTHVSFSRRNIILQTVAKGKIFISQVHMLAFPGEI